MEFDLEVQHGQQGHIDITDYSKEYNQYYEEDTQGIVSTEMYKYSESVSINAILKIKTNKVELMDVIIDNHKQDKETISFDVRKDGYYTVTHFVIPTDTWFQNQLTSPNNLLFNYSQIYYLKNGEIVKRSIQSESKPNSMYELTIGDEEPASIRELLERNIEGTTIKKCKVDIFYTGFLQECYINYCRELFGKLMAHCQPNCIPKNSKNDSFARDFLWMTLNVIDYLIQYKQFSEAQRILEEINYCGGFCNNMPNEQTTGCGCNTCLTNCGCGSH